jgi:PAS domain S-box-containing protein
MRTRNADASALQRKSIVFGAPFLLAILVAVLIVGLAWIAQGLLWKYAVDDVGGDHLAELDRDSYLIEARVRGQANNLFFLKRVAEAELARSPMAPAASDNLRSAVSTMMLARSQYDQVRLLDLSGHEVFRYNWKGGDHPLQEVAPKDLQDKSDRPYYRETLAAQPEDAVFSPLDLNIEHGQIEQPPKPVMRISGKIEGPDGKPKALLVLNYLGDQLLREVRQDTSKPRETMLLNGDGYWLVGPDPDSQWEFMYPKRTGGNLKEENPQLWKEITSAKSGMVNEKDFVYCFQNIDPLGLPADYPALRIPIEGGDRLKWTLLAKIPNNVIWESVRGIRRGIWITCGAGLIVLFPLVWFGGVSLERRRMDVREVREARTMLDSVIETSPHGIIVMEAMRDSRNRIVDLRLILSNRTASELLGEDLAAAQNEGRTMLKDHPETRENGSFERFCQVVETGEPVIFEEFFQKGSVQKWLSVRGAKREDGVVMTLVDITERKEAEEKLRQSEFVQRMAGQMSKVGGWSVDFPSYTVNWTEELYKLHGMPRDYQPTVDEGVRFYAPEYRDTIRNAFEQAVAGGSPFDVEAEIISATGERVWVRTTGEAEFNEGKLTRVVGAVQDITAAKNALLREQELRLQAQAAERAKSEFLAVMSHEIRTPMNGVIGMTSILADTSLTDVQRDCLNTIHSSGEALLTVINDILDFSKIESGKMNLERRPFDLRQCVEETVDLFSAQIREKKLEAAYLIAPDVPATMVGDSNRLRQILINLMGNAVKFTERGEITLKIESQGNDDNGYHLLFSVADTGIGIARDGVEKLFQSFQQVDSSMTRRYGGTGLGLVISRRLAELMDGKMWVESTPGAGSTFYFTAVLKAAPTAGSVATERAVLAPCWVLIVDDNATNRQILDTQLKTWGMNTISVASGHEALTKLGDSRFDIVLMDLQMPEMDGVTLAREMRKSIKAPFILLSSAGTVEIGEAGNLFEYQIPKPIKQSHLFEALQQLSGRGGAVTRKPVTKQFDGGMAARLPLRILLAEDNAVNQKVGVMMLGNMGYRPDLAGNGFEVLKAVSGKSYDLILMDVQMPEMDGVEAVRQLREKLHEHCPYIVALTANALEGDREKFLGLGFDDYLSKPLSPERLRGALERVPQANKA